MNKILIFISFFLISSIYSYIEGIDVSYYQGNIDWDKVKSEKQFAIIRMGYGNTGKDKKYEKYYEEAKSAGVQIGAYLYSYAKDATSAQKEANHALDLLKGKQFEWPIFYDIEEKEALKGDVNAILDTFCKILKDNNYYCGVYASSWYLNNKFDSDVLSKYAVWVAHYNVENPDFKSEWGIWQYSNKGSVSGINGDVDLDYAQINYADIIKSKGFNKSKKCFCYENFMDSDDDSEEDECSKIILEFLFKEICPLLPDENTISEEIDECELNYFCGSEETNANQNNNKTHYLNISILLFLISFLF